MESLISIGLNRLSRRCHKDGHATRRSKKCDEHDIYLASRKQPPQHAAQVDDNQQDDSANTVDAALVDNNDIHADSAEAQTARDASECDLLDSMDLDGNDDEFFDTVEYFRVMNLVVVIKRMITNTSRCFTNGRCFLVVGKHDVSNGC